MKTRRKYAVGTYTYTYTYRVYLGTVGRSYSRSRYYNGAAAGRDVGRGETKIT